MQGGDYCSAPRSQKGPVTGEVRTHLVHNDDTAQRSGVAVLDILWDIG